MINTVWLILIGLGIGTALANGQSANISRTIFADATKAIEFTLGLAGLIAFWSGIMRVAAAAGINAILAKLFRPWLRFLFPTIKDNQTVLGLISLTLAANLLGLGNVTTPLGLQTMTELQALNPDQERVSNEMCTFLALILGGLSVIPSTLIAIRSRAGSTNPGIVLLPIFAITLMGTIIILSLNYLVLKTNRRTSRKESSHCKCS